MQQQQNEIPGLPPMKLPNGGLSMWFGIISILFFPTVLLGLILGIIALVSGSNSVKEFNRYPGRYSAASLSKAKAGKITGIIGLSLSVILVILAVLNGIFS